MELTDNDTDIIFNPQIGVGNVLFSFEKKDIIKVLGNPKEEKIDIFNENEIVIYLFYGKNGINNVSLYYENNILDYLTIFVEDIILNGFRFSSFNKIITLEFVQKYHFENHVEYLCTFSYDEITEEECYYFENIGLTIWYEKDLISDICVQKTY